ncbi:MAG: helix-turn-helix domain-containing protein [Clostridia bacterium]|nr:helix-turn-helix domain-containing protein [Clostridia bacterium]
MAKTERVAELRDRLTEALKIRGMKAIDLSEKLDISRGTISYYMSGKSSPKADRLNLISQALNVSEAWLLGYDVPMERTTEQKKNDNIVRFVAQMRKENNFYNIVSELAELPPEQYAVVEAMILTLRKK